MMMKLTTTPLGICLLFAFIGYQGYSQTGVYELKHLKGLNPNHAESVLKHLGYQFSNNVQLSNEKRISYWNSSENACVTANIKREKITSVINVPDEDCHKSLRTYKFEASNRLFNQRVMNTLSFIENSWCLLFVTR